MDWIFYIIQVYTTLKLQHTPYNRVISHFVVQWKLFESNWETWWWTWYSMTHAKYAAAVFDAMLCEHYVDTSGLRWVYTSSFLPVIDILNSNILSAACVSILRCVCIVGNMVDGMHEKTNEFSTYQMLYRLIPRTVLTHHQISCIAVTDAQFLGR